MSVPTIAEFNLSSRPTVARTIPGLRHARSALSKKPVRSTCVDGINGNTRWGRSEQGTGLAGHLATYILPLPRDAHDRGRVLVNTIIGYLLVFVSLGIVHLASVMQAVPSTWPHSLAILWRELLASHLGHWILYGALIALLSYSEGLFEGKEELSAVDRIFMAAKAVVWATVVLGLGLHLCGAPIPLRTLASLASLMLSGQITLALMSHGLQNTGAHSGARAKNVLIVGTTDTAHEVARQLARAHSGARVVKGFVSRFRSREPSVLGTIDDLPRIARAHFIDEVIIAAAWDHQLAERAVAEAIRNHLDVSIVPDLLNEWPTQLSMQTVGPFPLISVHEEPIPRLGLLVKRVLDVLISAIALLLILPLMLVIAAAIKLESPGPALYCALRAGKKGRSFECFKFRTMYADANRHKDALRFRNERRGPTFKIVNDPRITPLGHVLRRYSLDELPQLWNVLTGSMSLVGPRPHPLDDYQGYELEDRRRLDVLPGLTGLWQITARSNPSFATNMALDLEYIENWSLGMDMKILLKTVPAVLAGTGA